MNQTIEQLVIVPDQPVSAHEALKYLEQCARLFRGDRGEFPSSDASPTVTQYSLDDRDVLVVSPQPGSLLIQIQTENTRRAYLYERSGAHPLIVNEYTDFTSDTPTSSRAITLNAANVPTIIDMCDYVNRAARHSQDS